MDKQYSSCDEQLIYRYFDKDMDPEENARFQNHLGVCKTCSMQLEHLKNQAEALADRINEESEKADFYALEKKVLGEIRRKNRSFFNWKDVLFKKIYVPATVAVAMTVLVSFYYFYMPLYSPPSAIINSFTGEFSSVMILETPETKQTILWINEDESFNVENQSV